MATCGEVTGVVRWLRLFVAGMVELFHPAASEDGSESLGAGSRRVKEGDSGRGNFPESGRIYTWNRTAGTHGLSAGSGGEVLVVFVRSGGELSVCGDLSQVSGAERRSSGGVWSDATAVVRTGCRGGACELTGGYEHSD